MKRNLLWLALSVLPIMFSACDKGESDPDSGVSVIPDDQPAPKVEAGGFYVVNEDWFGHDNGTVNYFKKNGTGYDITYRAYREANPNEEDWFGVTTQYAMVWGDNVYFSSKQGNRLVVADAKTLKKKAIFTDLGGDGRAIVGVDDAKIYIGHGNGIVVLDVATMQLGNQIEGVSGQIGSMCAAGGRVFAVSQRNGIYVINVQTDELEEPIAGTYHTITRSKDGNVWAASNSGLVKVDPLTLETETIPYPADASVGSSWGAWNAGSLCASTQNNVLYWTSKGKVIKYDIDANAANTELYTLGKSSHDSQLAFYGAGLRVDPLTDELILTVKHSGWGSNGAYNFIYKLDNAGKEIINFEYFGGNAESSSYYEGGYFWFPSMPLFEDANKPQILLNQILLKAGEQTVIDLGQKVVDWDNAPTSILKSVDFTGNDLVTHALEGDQLTVTAGAQAGSSTFTLSVVSNGVRIEKNIRVDVVEEI